MDNPESAGQAANTTALPERLSLHEAVARMAERRQATEKAVETPDFSAAGRTLAQAKAAKKAAQAEQVTDAGNTPAEDAELPAEDPEAAPETEVEAEAPSETDEDSPIIEIDGERLSAKELRARMMRQSDYTKKTQEAADLRKKSEAVVKSFDELNTKLTGNIQTAESLLAGLLSDVGTFDADAEYANDPIAAIQKERAYNGKIAKIQQAAVYLQQLRGQQAEALKAKTIAELATKYKGWSDATVRDAEMKASMDFAKTILPAEIVDSGYLSHPGYHELARLARIGAEAEKAKAELPKKVASVPQVIKPGTAKGQTSQANGALQRAQAEFDKNPTRENGLTLMAAKRQAANARRPAA